MEHHLNMAQFNDILAREEKGVIVVGGGSEKLGTILSCNCALQAMFSYSKEKLIDSKLEMIIPDIFQESHQMALLSSPFKNYEEDNDLIMGFGLHSSMCVFPIKIKVSKILNSEDNYSIIGHLASLQHDIDVALLIVDSTGIVRHCNSCIIVISCQPHIRNCAFSDIRVLY
jgi:hypothetical protein